MSNLRIKRKEYCCFFNALIKISASCSLMGIKLGLISPRIMSSLTKWHTSMCLVISWKNGFWGMLRFRCQWEWTQKENLFLRTWYLVRQKIHWFLYCWKLFWLKYNRGGELDFKTFWNNLIFFSKMQFCFTDWIFIWINWIRTVAWNSKQNQESIQNPV